MSIIRKTVRFHTGNPADMEILDAVCRFKEYGFRSESHMIMEALRVFLSNPASNCSPEELADLIADRLCSCLAIPVVTTPHDTMSQGSEDEAYNAAMSFLDSL